MAHRIPRHEALFRVNKESRDVQWFHWNRWQVPNRWCPSTNIRSPESKSVRPLFAAIFLRIELPSQKNWEKQRYKIQRKKSSSFLQIASFSCYCVWRAEKKATPVPFLIGHNVSRLSPRCKRLVRDLCLFQTINSLDEEFFFAMPRTSMNTNDEGCLVLWLTSNVR